MNWSCLSLSLSSLLVLTDPFCCLLCYSLLSLFYTTLLRPNIVSLQTWSSFPLQQHAQVWDPDPVKIRYMGRRRWSWDLWSVNTRTWDQPNFNQTSLNVERSSGIRGLVQGWQRHHTSKVYDLSCSSQYPVGPAPILRNLLSSLSDANQMRYLTDAHWRSLPLVIFCGEKIIVLKYNSHWQSFQVSIATLLRM